MICKNCERAYAVAGGYCVGCNEELEIEMKLNDFKCRGCNDELVKDEGDYCGECHQVMLEYQADAEKEERLFRQK